MAHKHDPEIPLGIEAVVTRLAELETVLGPQIAPVLDAVRAALVSAMAARDRGDLPRAVEQVSQAMHRLASFADGLDPTEATLMRALVQTFRTALLRGDRSEAQQSATQMFEKSGARIRKRE
jgi:hypothetical protein